MSEFIGIVGQNLKEVSGSLNTNMNECFEEDSFRCMYDIGFDVSVYQTDATFVVVMGFVTAGPGLTDKFDFRNKSAARYISEIYLNGVGDFYNLIDGNFSFCLFDREKKVTIIAKDKMGSRPLFFAKKANTLFFSTSQRLLMENSYLKMTLNNESLARYLALRPVRDGETFIDEIKKVKPHTLVVIDNCSGNLKQQQFRFRKYSRRVNKPLKKFQSLLEKAITTSWLKTSRVAVMFSGGLDSSAIAAGLKNSGYCSIETFSCNYSHLPEEIRTFSDESNFQNEVEKQLGLLHHSIELVNCAPIDSLRRQFDFFAQPTHFPNLYIFDEVAESVKSRKIEVIFDGQDGDNVISHGVERFREYLQCLNIIGFFYELMRYCKFNQVGFKKSVRYFLSHSLANWGIRKHKEDDDTLLKKQIFRKYCESDIKRITAVDSHLDKIENPLHSEALESKYIFFKHHKIQVRSPFYDKQLIEFCLSLPSRWKLRKGRTRYILRSYLISRDLDMIGNRNKKANLGYGLRHNITQLDLHKIKREINNVHPYLKGFIDTGVLSKYVTSVENTQKIEDFKLTSLLAFFSANTWLHHEMTERLTCKVQT